MNKDPLRIEQYATVLFNANLNPLGIPDTVKSSIKDNIDSIVHYPDIYYNKLRTAVAEYTGVPINQVVMGNGSTDLLKLFSSLVTPKKALLLTPGPTEYEVVLTAYNTELVFFELKEEDEFTLDVDQLIKALTDDLDMLILSNPNNPTSKKVEVADIRKLAAACKDKNIFLMVDEMYIEFLDNPEDYTSIPLVKEFDNMTVLRSVSKFFAVPGLRFAYAIINNPAQKQIIDLITTKNNIASLSAIAITNMFKDTDYIEHSRSVVHTERSLVYLAMSTSKTIKLYRPDANFMLFKLLRDDLTASDVALHCNKRGIILRKCDDIRSLDNKYIRICFMNPKQNDLMVNTILEIV
ncbi:MAG: aminotransferase class I/II-fold pyridoxal phosphate-dependent enzyme [Lachnospiraceae bacterium]|nr:aminotransferase class I/II-fold pyridoxal phosphate-dependent enzyme [Lachnospiraceae bacterium]